MGVQPKFNRFTMLLNLKRRLKKKKKTGFGVFQKHLGTVKDGARPRRYQSPHQDWL